MSPVWKITFAALAVGFLLVGGGYAFSHEAPSGWRYPYACCSNYDCRPVDAPGADRHHTIQINRSPEGFVISTTGEVIPYNSNKIKQTSPDGEWHWCSTAGLDTGLTICIIRPPDAF